MKVMVLVKASKDSEAGAMPSRELLTEMGKFNEELVKAGIMLSGEGLKPSSQGVRIRFSGKDRVVTDGPFTETNELVAGYWIWQVQSMEEAIAWVKRCPNPMTEDSEIEIRPFFSLEDFGDVVTPEFRQREERLRSEIDIASHAKNTICLWYDGDAEEAAKFYAATFPDSSVGAVHRAPGDYHSGKKGDVLTVEFTVLGIPCLGLNGGPGFKHNLTFSFQVATVDQEETDRYWNAIVGNGGEESECGWCKDKWGISWQITPIVLTKAVFGTDPAAAKRAFDAMMQMRKIDVAAIEASRRR